MLINADVKSLEIVVAAELSQDKVLCEEIKNKVDLHEQNRLAFNLPSRLIAKVFVFRLIYGGSAYSYANDPDFVTAGLDQRGWQKVIDNFYAKYQGVKKWHDSLVHTAMSKGYIEIPSGRFYEYKPKKNFRGENVWPRTTILNYCVQGFGADLVMLARIEFFKNFMESGLEGCFIQTIHDSLVVDTPQKNVYTISKMLSDAVESVPRLCKEHFDYDFSLPLTSEILVGPNKRDMEEYKIEN